MTLKLIDQALNVAITSLIYGSEAWLALAFALYVVTHKAKKAKAQKAEMQSTAALQSKAPPAISATKAVVPDERIAKTIAPRQVILDVDLEKVVEKAVEKIAVQKTLVSNTSAIASPQKAPAKEVSIKEVSLKPATPKETVPKQPLSNSPVSPKISKTAQKTVPAQTTAKAASQATAKKVVLPKLPKIVPPDLAPQQIVCEPVNWKKWKVSDLRKASIAKVCGVRMTPIGSRRKLSKADLIAQYEQNLKRMTKPPIEKSPVAAPSAYPQAAKRVV